MPIVLISAQLECNIDAANEYTIKPILIPMRDFSDLRMIVIRLFSVNMPGTEVVELKGSVAGGSILMGVLRLKMAEIWLGGATKFNTGRSLCQPIYSRFVLLRAETKQVRFAAPGGLIGVERKIDPMLCHTDRLCGHPPASIHPAYSSRAAWAKCYWNWRSSCSCCAVAGALIRRTKADHGDEARQG